MFKPVIITALAGSMLIGCAPKPKAPVIPTMTLEEAMPYCRGRIDEASRPKTSVGVGVGVGHGGKVRPRGGISVGIDVSSQDSKNKRYQSCVLEKSGAVASDTY